MSSSLGLHPVIYFYSKQGRYQVTAFMAILQLVREYEKAKLFPSFTKVRKEFELFIWKHKNIVNQATTTWGSGAKGYVNLYKLFDFIIKCFIDKKSEDEILVILDRHEDYNFFKAGVKELNPKKRKDASSESKSEAFIRVAIDSVVKCAICGGFLHKNSIQMDHDLEIENGGTGNAENLQPVHPYCNSIKKLLKSEVGK